MNEKEQRAAQRALAAKLRAAHKPVTAPERVLRGSGVPGAAIHALSRASEQPAPEATADRARTGRLEDGRFFIGAAADALANQQGMEWVKRQGLLQQMARCAALPYSHPHKLIARDAVTGLPLPEGAPVGISATVLPEDVNAWLEAQRMPYRWLKEPTAGLPEVDSTVQVPRVPLMAANVERVRRALAAAGFDPMNLPPFPRGLACPAKAAAEAGAGLSPAAFGHAWKALRKQRATNA